MKTILVTGANGQLGSELKELENIYKQYKFIFTDVNELDISNIDKLDEFFKKNQIDYLINCAAYTAVDKAETDKENSVLVNKIAVKNLAEATAKHNIFFFHVSTDYVFDGIKHKPYTESDTTNPKTIYGKTKLDGEVEILFNNHKAMIIRTSWLYSSYGHNFVKTILKNAKEKGSLKVVFDQIGTPTYARDLAKAILEIIPKIQKNYRTEIFNYSNEGVASWYDFSIEIAEMANIKCDIFPVETKEYPTPAQRPPYSVLNKSKIKTYFNMSIPYWKNSLKECLIKMNEYNR